MPTENSSNIKQSNEKISLSAFYHAIINLFNHVMELFTTEFALAGKQLTKLIYLIVAVIFIGVSAWMSLIIMVVFLLIHSGLPMITSLLILLLIQGAIGLLLVLAISSSIQHLSFSATRKAMKINLKG